MTDEIKGSSTRNWVLLLAISGLGFFSAEYIAVRNIAVPAICIIAVAKVLLILRNFMHFGGAPVGIRIYLAVWACVCGSAIAGMWYAA